MAEHQSDLDTMRHSAAHVMAAAVLRLFPGTKLGVGPAIENRFYYDMEIPGGITPDDLPRIEEEMRRIVAENHPFERDEISIDDAIERFRQMDQDYKVELLRDLKERGTTRVGSFEDVDVDPSNSTTASLYKTGEFLDLCRGPHVASSTDIGAFKLLDISGAYWRGDQKRPQLQRIYGTTWPSQADLDQYLWRLEEAGKRDHRRLGRELDLFSVSEDVGPGLVLWHPKGAMVRLIVEEFSRAAHLRNGYEWVFSPHIGRAHLWETSGHLDFYKESMYAPMDIDGEDYYVKPMNCPFHIQIFRSHLRSYRDLPKRYAEFGTVYRYELSGVLHGLTRVRGFTQDDAHIFCRPDQASEEINQALDFSLFVLRSFGLTDFHAYLATRPTEKSVGEDEDWARAIDALRRAVEAHQIPYDVDEGGGAFYGPKIDLKVSDALGREWQLSTIQFDFNLPARFGLEFIGEDGRAHQPYMVHRALLGSMERFLGVLIEHYAGAFPFWMSPVQAVVLPIADRHAEFAGRVVQRLTDTGFRVHLDARRENLNHKIRDAQLQKIPYMLVVGDREAESGSVAVRTRAGENLGAIAMTDLLTRFRDELPEG
ncbi:MAG: threonine--tRNA ligase [Chloroflexi bacterium]|nr:threonine--tRNA ligase [Chloroflexota bacterium]